MCMTVQLGTREDVGRERKAELAAVGRKMREREAKGRGMKVEGDVVKGFRLWTSLKGLVEQTVTRLFKSMTRILLRSVVEDRPCVIEKRREEKMEMEVVVRLGFVLFSSKGNLFTGGAEEEKKKLTAQSGF